MTTLKIELPAHERGRGPDEIKRFDRLKRKLDRSDLKPSQREAAAAELAALELAPAARDDKAWRDAAAAETEALATARGETVTQPKAGPMRVDDRDRLVALKRGGWLTERHLEVALAFRALYDARGTDLGALNYGDAGGTATNIERIVAEGFRRAKVTNTICAAEMRIFRECQDDPDCLVIFHGVIALNKALSSFGKGRAFECNAQALVRAIEIAEVEL